MTILIFVNVDCLFKSKPIKIAKFNDETPYKKYDDAKMSNLKMMTMEYQSDNWTNVGAISCNE